MEVLSRNIDNGKTYSILSLFSMYVLIYFPLLRMVTNDFQGKCH